MTNTDHYTYRVTWSLEDHEFVGSVAEFPSLSWLDADQIGALSGIRKVVAEVVADLSPEQIPDPFSERRYSGVFKLRIPPQLHRALAVEAAEQRVSLNRLVSSKLG